MSPSKEQLPPRQQQQQQFHQHHPASSVVKNTRRQLFRSSSSSVCCDSTTMMRLRPRRISTRAAAASSVIIGSPSSSTSRPAAISNTAATTPPPSNKRPRWTTKGSATTTPASAASAVVVVTPPSDDNDNATTKKYSSRNGEDLASSTTTTRGSLLSATAAVGRKNKKNRVDDKWHDLEIGPYELRPSAVLTTGQCFHWKALPLANNNPSTSSSSAWGVHNAKYWIGTIRQYHPQEEEEEEANNYVLLLQETTDTVRYKVLYPPPPTDAEPTAVREMLWEYFQMYEPLQRPINNVTDDKQQTKQQQRKKIVLSDLYKEWSESCPRLKRIAKCIPGVRVINQDPWETLVSFICSSNNNIPRIHKMLQNIRQEYGQPLLSIDNKNLSSSLLLPNDEQDLASTNDKNDDDENDDDEGNGSGSTILYSFPSLNRLLSLQPTEDDLRSKCGLGYRAKYLLSTMALLDSLGGESYLHQLRSWENPHDVQEALLQFAGVGRKVADCVALFSLQQPNAIPVDTHVYSVARRDYGATNMTTKSLTKTAYQEIGQLFQTRFGPYSGWAHSLLFVAELPSFRPALPEDLVQQMDEFRLAEKEKKKTESQKKRMSRKG